MKIINTSTPIDKHELLQLLQKKVNPLFRKQRQQDLAFEITEKPDAVEIAKPGLYEGYLFNLKIKGNDIEISKTEHYTDDVNILTLEEIINDLLLDYPGRENIDLITEES
jgi:hypothetical protein